MQHHRLSPSQPLNVSERDKANLQFFEKLGFYEHLVELYVSTRRQDYDGNLTTQGLASNIPRIVQNVRFEIEKVSGQVNLKPLVIKNYGRDFYKCSIIDCVFFTKGFTTAEDRDQHACRREQKPIADETTSGKRKRTLSQSLGDLRCGECGREFKKRYNLNSHLRSHANRRE